MSDLRRISDEYTRLGMEVIEEQPELEELRNGDVQVIFLASSYEKKHGGKPVLGQCEKISDKYKWGRPCDFTVTVFEPNCEGMSEEQLKILLFHELLHIGVEDERLYVKPHDLEDFKVIIDRFGTNWAEV